MNGLFMRFCDVYQFEQRDWGNVVKVIFIIIVFIFKNKEESIWNMKS